MSRTRVEEFRKNEMEDEIKAFPNQLAIAQRLSRFTRTGEGAWLQQLASPSTELNGCDTGKSPGS
jgi:hypothetical protein